MWLLLAFLLLVLFLNITSFGLMAQKTNSFKNKFSITYVKRLLFLSLHSCCITNLIKFWIIIILLLWVLITSKNSSHVSYGLWQILVIVQTDLLLEFFTSCSVFVYCYFLTYYFNKILDISKTFKEFHDLIRDLSDVRY